MVPPPGVPGEQQKVLWAGGWGGGGGGAHDGTFFIALSAWEHKGETLKTTASLAPRESDVMPPCHAEGMEPFPTIVACPVSAMGMSPQGQLCLQSLMPLPSPYGVKKGQQAGPHPLVTQSRLTVKGDLG